jgi:hypothetical protein
MPRTDYFAAGEAQLEEELESRPMPLADPLYLALDDRRAHLLAECESRDAIALAQACLGAFYDPHHRS